MIGRFLFSDWFDKTIARCPWSTKQILPFETSCAARIFASGEMKTITHSGGVRSAIVSRGHAVSTQGDRKGH